MTCRSKKIDLDKFKEDLGHFDSSNDKLDYFNQTFHQILNDHAPLYRVQTKKEQSPWVTREIRDQMDIRDKSLRHFRATKSADDWEAYRGLHNRVNLASSLQKSPLFPPNLW